MTDSARIRLFQLAAETACLIATADDPALARQQFMDDLTGELLLGAVNLAGSARLLEAFRDAMGYSVRVPVEDGSPSAFRVVEGGGA